MKRKKLLFILALLCAIVQGAWAQDYDVWDGHSESQPKLSQDDLVNGIYTLKITSGAELNWLHEHWSSNIYTPYYNVDVDECNFVLMRDLDLTAASWVPLDVFYKKFDGRGHTIKLKIRDTSDNYQGLFKQIESSGEVRNLHVDCDIKVGNATNVAGICGENEGTIENCWVSGHIESSHYSANDADLGGIAGLNDNDGTIKYCCVAADIKNTGGNSGVGGIAGSNEGTIQHVTFYGTVDDNGHGQDNKYVGDQDGTLSNYYDSFNQSEYNDASGYDVYRHALKYPYTFNISTSGFDIIGRVQVSAGGETDIPGWRYGETVTLTQTRGLVQSLTIKDADNNNVSFSGNVTDGWTFTMPRSDVNIHVVFTTPAWLNHAGTMNDPYSIATTADYEDFATIVNNAVKNFSGEYVKLKADINNITSPVGYWRSYANNKPFSGTFLGEGHTITVTLNDNIDGLAPFSYIDGATIKNLKVAGTITSSQDSQEHIAGVVGLASGNSTIEGCVVTATLNVIGENAGGIFGRGLASATTTIRGCVFAGTINGVGDNTGRIGGIVDWYNSAEATNLEACLESGTYTNIVSMHPMGLNPSQGTITNSYYVNPKLGNSSCTLNGAKQAIVLTSAPDNLGTLVQNYGMVKAYQNGILYDGAYYVAFTLSGAGTETSPYIIGNASHWNDFATYVTNGNNFSGKFVKLNADIEVSTMAGKDDANSFQGTFDGGGNTLTFTKGTSGSPFNENYCAPFRHVKNAVIMNMHVDGTIYTSVQKAAGFVGESHGNLGIAGCRSSVNIHSSKSGDGTHGGFVATLSGSNNTIIIDGCVFDGSFATTASTTNCGGFVGWPVYNKPYINNSLMKPSSVDKGMLINTFARRHDGYEPTIYNCYYVATDNLPTDDGKQGTQAYALDTAPANLGNNTADYDMVKAYANGILYGGKYYVAPATISLANNADNTATISNADGYLADVTLNGRTLNKDGYWNTLCLPFNVVLDGSPLAGATTRTLTAASITNEGKTLNLTFGDPVSELVAGAPYIIKWTGGGTLTETDLVFNGVVIDKTNRSYDNNVQGDARVRFLGTYDVIRFTADDQNSVLLMGTNNTLRYAGAGAGLGACRAYFKIGEDGTTSAPQLTSFSIDYSDGETTGIISLTPAPSPNGEGSDGWYSLDGRKLDSMPTAKGIYVNNGRKVVVK